MPIYEFHCSACDKASELLVRSIDCSSETCPHCGSDQILKQLSTFAPATADGSSSSIPPAECTGNPGACGMC
ncbi:MAG TPA: zinc ribbon domain-containing protein [Verrucomicrobiales bacterium]|nr:zinc ribbon domain-containing protein [Verrucomicrobiales bacterium]